MIDPLREALPLGQTNTPAGYMTGACTGEMESEEKSSISSCGSLLVINSFSDLPRLQNLRQVEE
jgi:hypothetical protein